MLKEIIKKYKFFNHIPCFDLKYKSITYDYKTNKLQEKLMYWKEIDQNSTNI